jgi:hypothetical protein
MGVPGRPALGRSNLLRDLRYIESRELENLKLGIKIRFNVRELPRY